MKKIDLVQGSSEWLAWRKTVITATDCPAILGSSPWSTAYKCWLKKKGLLEEQKPTEAMERGTRLEPLIRERFIRKYGINMTPTVVESSEYNFLGASLDGLSDCGQYILEIKTGGNHLYKMALNGMIPEYYQDQIQQQLLVTGAIKGFCQIGSEDEAKDIIIEVPIDSTFKDRFLPKAREFLKCLALDECPPLQNGDYKDMTDQPVWKGYAEEYRKIADQIKSLEEIKESYRKELLKLCDNQNCIGAGIKIMKTIIKGRIAYDEIPEIKDLNLDKYRKSPTTSWKILTA